MGYRGPPPVLESLHDGHCRAIGICESHGGGGRPGIEQVEAALDISDVSVPNDECSGPGAHACELQLVHLLRLTMGNRNDVMFFYPGIDFKELDGHWR